VGEPALRRLPRSSLYWVNSGWTMGRPTRLIERQPPASVANVDTAQTPIRRDRIAVQINFEFVHSFRMIARRRDRPENGVANIDCEHRACLSAEYVQVRDVEAYILACDR
jgi:hypothetical protein